MFNDFEIQIEKLQEQVNNLKKKPKTYKSLIQEMP